jgi:hypothetical protein
LYTAVILLAGILAAIAVAFATRALGRLAGVSTAALCAASLAFFMEPAFSFVIDNTFDRVTLVVYGIASLFVVHRSPGRQPVPFRPAVEPRKPRSESQPATALADMIQTALARNGCDAIPVDIDPGIRFRGLPGEVRSLLTGILELALGEVLPLRIMVSGADLPGRWQIWIALQYRPTPEEPYSIIIGRRPDQCFNIDTGSHPGCAVSSFDNGFERVLQISYPHQLHV